MITFLEFISNLNFEDNPPSDVFKMHPELKKTNLQNKNDWSIFVNNVLNVMDSSAKTKDSERSFYKILSYFNKDNYGVFDLIGHIIQDKVQNERVVDAIMEMWARALKSGSLDVLSDEPNPEWN